MFSLGGILTLIIVACVKPQEVWPALQAVPILYLATGLAILGLIVDTRLRVIRLRATPQLLWVVLMYVWCLITCALKAPEDLTNAVRFIIPITLYLVIGHGVQTFRSLQIILGVTLAIGLLLAFVGAHQAFAPYGCFKEAGGASTNLFYDGRPCEDGLAAMCRGEGSDPSADYRCEHVGLLDTSSIGGRVRYRGSLEDPNELALTVGIALPFAFAFFERRKSFATGLLLATSLTLVGMCAIFTQSRGGQLVLMAVLGVYFIRKFGIKGLIFGGVLAMPLLLLGGRSDADAEGSTLERLEAWATGIDLFRGNPVIGVGFNQFGQYHYLTAHSSYILPAAETGFIGMVLFSTIIYVSIKTAFVGTTQAARGRLAPIAGSWSQAILAAFVGMAVGIAFLSFNDKQVLWIYLGIAGALYQCIKRHDPAFTIRMSLLELSLIGGADIALVSVLRAYAHVKGAD